MRLFETNRTLLWFPAGKFPQKQWKGEPGICIYGIFLISAEFLVCPMVWMRCVAATRSQGAACLRFHVNSENKRVIGEFCFVLFCFVWKESPVSALCFVTEFFCFVSFHVWGDGRIYSNEMPSHNAAFCTYTVFHFIHIKCCTFLTPLLLFFFLLFLFLLLLLFPCWCTV